MSNARKINNFPDYYVTDDGHVYSRSPRWSWRIKRLMGSPDKNGYICVTLYSNNRSVTKKVHRIVAQAFVINPDKKPEVNHKNGLKTDNKASNLEWVTNQENISHAHKILNCKKRAVPGVEQILDGKTIARFSSQKEAARMTRVAQPSISLCCRGKRATAGGYVWRYADAYKKPLDNSGNMN